MITSLRRDSGVTFRSLTLPFSRRPSTVVFFGAWSLKLAFQFFGQAGAKRIVSPSHCMSTTAMATNSPVLMDAVRCE